jgi:hypothetical protein
MSAIVLDQNKSDDAPSHINVKDLTFGYVGREVPQICLTISFPKSMLKGFFRYKFTAARSQKFEYAVNKRSTLSVDRS